MKISHIAETVKSLMIKYPELKDDDKALIANVWYLEIPNITNMNAFDILQLYAKGQLTNSESIRRSRQKLQQENPELRGKVYEARHAEQEVVKDDLKDKVFYGTRK